MSRVRRHDKEGAPEGDAPPPDGEAGREPAGSAAQPATPASPSMAQYLEIKAANPDSLLWYRMGDFYELFFEDAVVASAALGIVLTKRGKHSGRDIPMCGVPIHRADEYLQRLIRAGYRVAVCEQLEAPAEARKRGSKAVVRRDVVRLVTPGTLTEDALLDAKARNYLTAIFRAPSGSGAPVYALASIDISTGEFEIGETAAGDIASEIVRLSPGEVVLADGLAADPTLKCWIGAAGAALTPVPAAYFDSLSGETALKAQLGVAELGGFGTLSRAELAAAGAALKYIDLTQIGRKPLLRPPRRTGASAHLIIDPASRASLELLRATNGDRGASLLGAIDRTVTGPGARELAARLSSPLADPAAIERRLDAVDFLVAREPLRHAVREALKPVPDVARAMTRLAFNRGGPRDLGAIRDGLSAAAEINRLLDGGAAGGLPGELTSIAARLGAIGGELRAKLDGALADELPSLKRDGGYIRPGHHPELDGLRRLRDDSRGVMAALEARYIADTSIKTLKIRHNNILGFFIEVGQASAKPLLSPPHEATFRHRQTMASAMRFTTGELIEIEGRIASATERALALEHEIFAELTAEIERHEQALSNLAAALAELDVTGGLGELAHLEAWVRPAISSDPTLDVRGGRHPVVERALKAAHAAPFIENDCVLELSGGMGLPPGFDEHKNARLWLVTGPNMAGKSTFLRQNALIAILAQMGSFVPAEKATIGIVDRLFSRVGASDDLASGRSTFMVEMVETAAILNQATDRSLVILDEIGRGTATFDGLSIAWACVEYLHDVCKCRALFATHYHELTALARRLPYVANVTMDAKEWHDEIVFLHKIKPGAADRSYGIQVAKLAGLPGSVVKRAREVLNRLERTDRKLTANDGGLQELPLFSAAAPPVEPRVSEVEAALEAMKPDEMTPKAALDALYRLKGLRGKGDGRR